jgi:hypothetical protein
VSAPTVVEAVYVLKEGLGEFVTGGPCVPPDQFDLKGFELGFDCGIVVTVTPAAHSLPGKRLQANHERGCGGCSPAVGFEGPPLCPELAGPDHV